MVLKSYFDGGNDVDSTQYDYLTLACIAGSSKEWEDFNLRWGKVLKKHHTQFLHTTDAMSLQGVYKNWTPDQASSFIRDCVTVLADTAAISHQRLGLHPITITVKQKDFLKALDEIPELGTPDEICATQCANEAFAFGRATGRKKFELYFDQNERFYRHIHDRRHNKKSLRSDPFWSNVIHAGESSSQDVPALQGADLFAWATNDAYSTGELRQWQKALLVDIERTTDYYDYDILTNEVRHDVVARVNSWKLPPKAKPK
jgi:hypothetical protein